MDDDLQPHPRACCPGRDTRKVVVTNPILAPFDETVYFGSHGLRSRRPTT